MTVTQRRTALLAWIKANQPASIRDILAIEVDKAPLYPTCWPAMKDLQLMRERGRLRSEQGLWRVVA